MSKGLELVDAELAKARAGGGERYVARHRERGKMDRPRAGRAPPRPGHAVPRAVPVRGLGHPVRGGGIVHLPVGIGVVEGVECLISATDPTVRGGGHEPVVVPQGRPGIPPILHWPTDCRPSASPSRVGPTCPGPGRAVHPRAAAPSGYITRHSAAAIPTVAVVPVGRATAGGAYVPGMSDYVVMIDKRSKGFLGGPPLVKMGNSPPCRA